MSTTFQKLDSNPQRFFDMLPQDWQDDIVPYWTQYKNSAHIYIIEDDDQIIGGGIVFSTCPPDVLYYETEAQIWFGNGYLYLGFIWISESKRGINLGSFWLDELKNRNPKQSYWLLIEEEHLHRFYQKNAFVQENTIFHDGKNEWLYKYDAP